MPLKAKKPPKDVETFLFGDSAAEGRCLPDFQDMRFMQLFVCNIIARVIKVHGAGIVSSISVERYGEPFVL